ncbi:hypothetical protein JW848_07140 [Candidatus Bipolaricaulota bacterium]|nr:hypothetical protein [Candidatus Bipolaricaulota bacterium]
MSYWTDKGNVSFSKDSLWEPAINGVYTNRGQCPGNEWLAALRALVIGEEKLLKRLGLASYVPMQLGDAIDCLKEAAKGDDIEHVVLDSHSIIENGEAISRREGKHEPTLCQMALLKSVPAKSPAMKRIPAEAVDELIAEAMAEIGVSEVRIHRHETESAMEIIGVSTSGSENAEFILLQVGWESQGIAVSTLDRLIGFPEYEGSDRMVAVSSAHTVLGPEITYTAPQSHCGGFIQRALSSTLRCRRLAVYAQWPVDEGMARLVGD